MNHSIRGFLAFLTFGLLGVLTACGGSSGSVPPSCPQGDFLAVMNDYVNGSGLIDTPWEPAPNTDLNAALDAGGVACSYGIQEAEVGATVMWAPGTQAFEERREQWRKDGQRQAEITGVNEAWVLEESNGTEEFLWQVNLLIDDAWIQINATFLRDVEVAMPLIDAAISEVRG